MDPWLTDWLGVCLFLFSASYLEPFKDERDSIEIFVYKFDKEERYSNWYWERNRKNLIRVFCVVFINWKRKEMVLLYIVFVRFESKSCNWEKNQFNTFISIYCMI